MTKELCYVPHLTYPNWNLKNAYNLALFSSLAYAELEEEKILNFTFNQGAENIFRALENHEKDYEFYKIDAKLFLEEAPKEMAFSTKNLMCFEELGVKLYINSNPDTVIIFIQGTENVQNFFADIAKQLIPKNKDVTFNFFIQNFIKNSDFFINLFIEKFNPSSDTSNFILHKRAIADYLLAARNAEAHLGFLTVLASFLHEGKFLRALADHEIRNKKVFICGHSLGGALALLLARELQPSCENRICLYTFGCPRVGSKKFVQTIDKKILHYRVINKNDPFSWLGKEDFWFDHGKIKHIYQDQNGDLKIKLTAFNETDWVPDHFIKNYIENIRTIISKANRSKILL